jgi:hypothetical protein
VVAVGAGLTAVARMAVIHQLLRRNQTEAAVPPPPPSA